MRRAFIDVGSNLEREASLQRALELLEEDFGRTRRSAVFQSDPVGFSEQPAFYNMSVEIYTELEPPVIRELLRAIENQMGRVRTENKYGPRNIDLDLVWVEGVVELGRLPHPQVLSQAFVLVPLCELAAELVHPETGRTLLQELAALPIPDDLHRLGPIEQI